MAFPGTWMTESGTMAYRVVPKCACSTIGQIMHFTDHGRYFDGDIHDAEEGLVKWADDDSQARITAAVRGGETFNFTCVRNPYARILSAFFDKICGIQRTGGRYRGNLVPLLIQKYGIEVEGEFDQIRSFRRFLLFARDTITWRRPMPPDIHWSDMAGHVGTFVANGGRYDRVFFTEDFDNGMAEVLSRIAPRHPVAMADVPRFNESEGHGPRRAHPVAAYFDDLAQHLMLEMYKRDFEIFGYDFENPSNQRPLGPVDMEKMHLLLADG